MIGSGATEVASAAISAVGVMVGAALAAWAVVTTARMQKRPKIVDMEEDELRVMCANERSLRLRAEAERDVWKQIALDARNGLPDLPT